MSAMPPNPSLIPAHCADETLVDMARDGDVSGVGGLYDRHAARMMRVAWRLTGSAADAEDVVHDVFVGLSSALHRYQHRGSVEAWLAQVTARAALMRMRGRRRRRETDLSDASAIVSGLRTDLAAEYADLERQIDALPDALREVFVLREIEGFTHEEVADLLGISAGASRVRLSRALVALRHALRHALQASESPTPRAVSAAARR